MSDYELLQRQLARARIEAESGRMFPMEEWLGVISLSNNTPEVVDEVNKIREIGYKKGIDDQFNLAEYWTGDGNLSAVMSCLQVIETYAEKGRIPLPKERIDDIRGKIGLKI